MGQRHQFYVIAKVGGRYRLLAAAHHQWLYGDAAITQCQRVLQTMSAAGNLSSIRRELRGALDVDWSKDIWIDKSRKQANDSLFPFISTCLAIASSLGSSSCQTMLLSVNTHFYDVTSDDGISIYDITEPQRPRYAFMYPGENCLIDALQYFHHYSSRPHRSSWPTDLDRKSLSPPNVQWCLDFRPIPVEAMYDIWSRAKIKFTSIMLDVSATMAPDPEVTLNDRSLARLLDSAFESIDLPWMTQAELLPEFRPALKSKLYDDPDNVLSSSLGLELLARPVSGDSIIDLSPFPLSLS